MKRVAPRTQRKYAAELVTVEMTWTNRIGVQFDYVAWCGVVVVIWRGCNRSRV
jgi:hypothetical protein